MHSYLHNATNIINTKKLGNFWERPCYYFNSKHLR